TSPAVGAQAAWPLWPTRIPGPPRKAAPATASCGVRNWTRYQWLGMLASRWGSDASSGRPVAVREAATVQLFEAPPALVILSRADSSWLSRSSTSGEGSTGCLFSSGDGMVGVGCQAG